MNAKRFLQSVVSILILLAALFPLPVNAAPTVLYVKPGGLTSGACDSWANACELQYALTSAVAGQEIWVAAGVYKPTTDPTDRTATFQLKNGVGLYGGFTGTETTRNERNWETNKTILSGDIDNNDVNTDGNFIAESTVDIQGANSFHIVIGSNINNTVVLDGIIVTAGNADGTGNNISDLGSGIYNDMSSPRLMNVTFSGNLAGRGAGMYNLSSSPSLTNVTFSGNSVGQTGGGMDNISGSNPSLVNVTFSNNSAGAGGGMDNDSSSPSLMNVTFNGNSAYATGGGMENTNSSPSLSNVTFSSNSAGYGGGMWNWVNSSPNLVNVTFIGNSAERGGGMFNREGSNPSIVNVIFSSNSAGIGGGMYNEGGSPILKNVIFISNSAVPLGGGMYNSGGSPSLTNVTFSRNSAASGGGIANEYNGNPIINNSILYNDSGGEIFSYVSSPTLSYSIVQGGYAGAGNIDADPLFVDAANGNLHVQAGSPAIDSGTNDGCVSPDFEGVPRPQDGNGDGIAICDMGAYEFVSQVITVKIDIKPGSSTNPINLGANGVIPVAVLTTSEFNAATLDPTTVLFAGAFPLRWSKQDVDYDRDMDLLFHFDVKKLQLTQSSVEASLTGKTYTGMSVKGTDKVKIVPVVSYP